MSYVDKGPCITAETIAKLREMALSERMKPHKKWHLFVAPEHYDRAVELLKDDPLIEVIRYQKIPIKTT